MTISVFDLFSVGIGPSSSHTVGPMRAAERFIEELGARLTDVAGIQVELYGSLAATGAGHGTLSAVMVGLEGYRPESVSPETIEERVEAIRTEGTLLAGGVVVIPFAEADIVRSPRTVLPTHSNGMRFTATASDGDSILERVYFSIGGGFVIAEGDVGPVEKVTSEYDFHSAEHLLELCVQHGVSVSELMMLSENARHTREEVAARMLHIRDVMVECRERSIERTGDLPGGLGVRRRAAEWHRQLKIDDPDRADRFAEDWVNLVALAVNEENASGGRVVTAPTNGAAGIIPAVLYYAVRYTDAGRADPDGTAVRFLLVAGAIGSLYKEMASISAAEVGCQGEVGSAASMAAGALAEILGGTPQQVENAAEIAMEHLLGLTCDPISGLVQVPCIERNAISAGTAINAARMALRGDGTHRVSLDEVIATMRATGADMHTKYKETAMGGLAITVSVAVPEC